MAQIKAMPLPWVKHLRDPHKREQLELTLRNSQVALNRLREVLQEMEDSLQQSESSLNDFDDPNWSHKQAFRNGAKSSLKQVKDLLDFIS